MERRRLPSSINKSVPHDKHRRASSIKTSRRTEKDKGGASGPRPGAADSRSCSRRPPCRLQSKVARESRRRLSQFEPFSARTANPARLALPRRERNYSKWPSPTNLPVDTERSSPNRRFAIRTNAKRTRHCRNESAIVKQHSRTEIFVARLGIAITPPRVPCTCNRIDKLRNSASRFDRSLATMSKLHAIALHESFRAPAPRRTCGARHPARLAAQRCPSQDVGRSAPLVTSRCIRS